MNRRRDSLKAAITIAVLVLGCSDATSGTFASLRFSEQPAGAVAGQVVAFAVEFVDANGDRAAGVNDDVVIALGAGASATGARTVSVRSGIATVDDFVVTVAGDNQVLSATARGLSTVSLPFPVTAGLVNAERSTVAPTANQSLLANTPLAVVFTFNDEFGNPIPRAEVRVTSDLAGATLTPIGGKTTDLGTFQTTYRPPAVGSARFSAVVNGQSIAIPSPLPVNDPCAPRDVTIPATMAGTLVQQQGCILAGEPFQRFRFTTTTGGGVSMSIGAAFAAEFELRTDPAVASVRLVAIEPVVREWLLPAGTYEFRIGAIAGQGSYNVTATPAQLTTGAVMRVIAAPGTYTGQTLASGDFVNGVDGYTDSFAVFSSRPCTITVRSTAFDPWIQLVSEFGTLIGFDDNSGGGTDARIIRSSCSSAGGAIRIDVAAVNSAATGAYTITIAYN